jgi:hypothetical protein
MTEVDPPVEDQEIETEAAVVHDPWPLAEQVAELEQIQPKAVLNADNLGSLRFTGADQQFVEILAILRDLSMEEWDELPTDIVQEVQGNVGGLLGTVQQMVVLDPATNPNYQADRDNLQRQFTEYYNFFRNRVRPLCLTAKVATVLRTRSDLWGGDLSPERLGQLQEQLDRLEGTASELQALAPLVKAQRELVEESGVAKLSQDFDARATEHGESFRRWAWGLIGAVVIGGCLAVIFIFSTRPSDDASNADIVTHVLLDVLVLGLILFLVRFVALQTRAHRHMQFVAKNKANALSTFNRIVSGPQEQDVRANIAAALAQAVFNSDDGVFSDSTSDTVTIIERVGAAASSRLPTSS